MTTTTHRVMAVRSGTTRSGMDFDLDYEITFSYLPGAGPILHPADDAEPGYPPSIDFVSIEPDVGDHGAFTDLAQKELAMWAQDWLSEHYEDLVDQAEMERLPDPDDARDRMIEDRETRERDRGE